MNTMLPMTRMIDAALCNHPAAVGQGTWNRAPRVDVLESDAEYRILMDLPGVKSDNLEINLEDQDLTVKAEREIDLDEGWSARRRERPARASFSRTFSLGNAVEIDHIGAHLEDGVLQITLPKSEKSVPRRIEVK